MAEHVRCLLRAARPGGLTSPEPVTAPSTAPAATIKPDTSRTRTSRRTVSGTTAMPPDTAKITIGKIITRKRSPEFKRWIEA